MNPESIPLIDALIAKYEEAARPHFMIDDNYNEGKKDACDAFIEDLKELRKALAPQENAATPEYVKAVEEELEKMPDFNP